HATRTGGSVATDDDSYLGYFMGPLAERSDIGKDLLLKIFDDHAHWRRNYFSSDPSVFSPSDRQRLAAEGDMLADAVVQLLAKLRRSFPFHSPRYIAHQQSELSLPALLGVI